MMTKETFVSGEMHAQWQGSLDFGIFNELDVCNIFIFLFRYLGCRSDV